MFKYLDAVITDKEIEKVNAIFNTMLVEYNKYKHNTADIGNLFKDKADEISKIISNRFNTSIKIKVNNKKLIGVEPPVNQSMIDIKNRLRKKLDKQVIKKGLSERLSRFLYTLNEVEKELREGLTLDTSTFKFNSNKFKFVIHLDIKFLISKQLTGDEITAIILHEIGHIYTNFISLPSIANGAIDVTYDILGRINEGGNIDKIVLKTMEEKGGEELNTVSSENVFKLYKKYMIDNNANFSGYSLSYSNENMADKVSVKFGYGASLASALSKVSDTLKNTDSFYLLGNAVAILGILTLLFIEFGATLIMFALMASIASTVIVFSIVAGVIALVTWLFARLFNTSQLVRNTGSHEDILTRVSKIKNKIISLSTDVDDKATGKLLIGEIKKLNGIINDLHNKLGIDLNKLISTNSEYEVINTVDSLINNELYIQSLRLKYLKGDD